ncbi:sugar ABC transporter substrate-binding protein [Bombiscardovia nodaiensis]|uniref:Sugar ABC transporter substrate-binding protein n=1 Tax=Bombiscardovia nodaiensis TaxID=2932181 RepID=A0ABM8BA52_9BIFI|nr:sugar ABC transporter substrate-binding protein [Bombiscardovia nodaiensis]
MRSFTKKLATATLAAVASLAMVGSLAGCGSNGAGKDDLVLTIWGGDTDKQTMQQRLDLAKKKYPSINVKLQYIAKDYDTKIQTMFSGGTAPDILEMAENINAYSSRGQLADLTAQYPNAEQQFGKANVQAYSYKGKMYGAPDRSAPGVVYYNKDIFDAAGVQYPSENWDWNTFVENTQKLVKRDGNKTTQWAYCEGDWWAWYMTWIYQNGGKIIDSNGKPVVNSSENVEAMQFYQDLMYKYQVAPKPEQITDSGADPLFSQGKLAMEVTGFWNVGALKDVKFNWGVAPMWHGKKTAVPMFSNALAVSSQSKHKEDAMKIVKFLSSKEGQKPIAENGLDVPANVEAAADKSFTEASWNKQHIDLSVFAKSTSMTWAPPFIPEWNQITKAMSDGMSQTWNGKQDVKTGLDKAQKTLEGALKK